MPPKQRIVVQSQPRRSQPQQQPTGILSNVYHELTAPENQSVVRGVLVFGVAVTFLSSSWSEILLPA